MMLNDQSHNLTCHILYGQLNVWCQNVDQFLKKSLILANKVWMASLKVLVNKSRMPWAMWKVNILKCGFEVTCHRVVAVKSLIYLFALGNGAP